MDIYLWTNEEWKLFSNPSKEELSIRNIKIGYNVALGDNVKIGNNVIIGNFSKIENNTEINNGVQIGNYVRIGVNVALDDNVVINEFAVIKNLVTIGKNSKIGISVEIDSLVVLGNYCKIANFVWIGEYAEINNNVEIGEFTFIGKSVKISNGTEIFTESKIGDFAVIRQTAPEFSIAKIFQLLQILPDKDGFYTVYKSVKPDLTSFREQLPLQYYIGMEWRNDTLSRNQEISCGAGTHWSTYSYAVAFAEQRKHVILEAKVHIDDILSVYQKFRVKAFKEVRIIDFYQ